VGLRKPNPWGLFDIIGNLWKWCEDVWHGDYVGAPIDGSPWLSGADRQPRRCLRGGAWNMDAFRCRSTYRSWDRKDVATNRFGFRIAVQISHKGENWGQVLQNHIRAVYCAL
jgi:formylglycine-generating enzyme required for sulfatase activity